jgi:4-amino-4-deoxy-L-arabinose transferase-like glycosyltransferase
VGRVGAAADGTIQSPVRPRNRRKTFHWVSALAAGVLAGAAAVTRLQGLLFLGAVCLVILVWPRLRRVRLHAVLILLFMGMSLGAWGMRNKSGARHFLIGTTHDGITLWEANYPSAREALVRFGTVEPLDQERMIDDFARTQTLDEYQANQYFTQRGTRYILEHPGDVALTAG